MIVLDEARERNEELFGNNGGHLGLIDPRVSSQDGLEASQGSEPGLVRDEGNGSRSGTPLQIDIVLNSRTATAERDYIVDSSSETSEERNGVDQPGASAFNVCIGGVGELLYTHIDPIDSLARWGSEAHGIASAASGVGLFEDDRCVASIFQEYGGGQASDASSENAYVSSLVQSIRKLYESY